MTSQIEWQKRYAWRRTWGDETGIDGKPHEDFSAYDGDVYAGRIRLEIGGPMNGKWHWAGSYPKGRRAQPIKPNAGYVATAAEAAQTVERYWDAMKSAVTV